MNQEIINIATAAVQRYAEMHPRPVQVTQTQAADMLGLCIHTVRKLIKNGSIRLNECGLIPISEVDNVLASRNRAA